MNLNAIHYQAQALAFVARAAGVHLTIETRSLRPLAMGNVEMVVDVRPARGSTRPARAAAPTDLDATMDEIRAFGESCERLGFVGESAVEDIRRRIVNLIVQTRKQTITDCAAVGPNGSWPFPAIDALDPAWPRPAMQDVERERIEATPRPAAAPGEGRLG